MVPVFGWMLLSHPDQIGWRIATTVVFAAAIGTDALDGKIARRYNLVTSFGKLADPIADKALTGMAFVGLSVLGDLWWWVTITILIREWGITVMRFVIIRYGVMAANRGGKLKTLLQTGALVLFLLPIPHWLGLGSAQSFLGGPIEPFSCLVMAAAWVVTIVSGIDYVREAIRMRNAARTGDPGRGDATGHDAGGGGA